MIKDPPILRVRRKFPRPAPELIRMLTSAMTGHLADAMGGSGALDWRIKPLGQTKRNFCGTALTCDAGPADNLALLAALDVAKPGDVIVAATAHHLATAVAGDLFAGMARNCGVAASPSPSGNGRTSSSLQGLDGFSGSCTADLAFRDGGGLARRR